MKRNQKKWKRMEENGRECKIMAENQRVWKWRKIEENGKECKKM